MLFFLAVHRHYEHVGRLLRGRRLTANARPPHLVVLVRDLGPATVDAVGLPARDPSGARGAAVRGAGGGLRDAAALGGSARRGSGDLEMLPGAEEHPYRAVRRYVRNLRPAPTGS